ncbi:MAG: class I SAM-dependent methyltransferase [Candidatus Aminicenantes bacterium]|nr:class I SAM-dependent methyltransferase [Candidatus Aminicenantes bacterium]
MKSHRAPNGRWSSLWDRRLERWRESLRPSGAAPCRVPTSWETEEEAWTYWENVQHFQRERIDFLIGLLAPFRGKKILDIGSGPGVLALPLAEAGASVTAVDSSPAMLRVLEAKKNKSSLAAVSGLNLSWEDVDPGRDLAPPYDAVIASLSLTMRDIRASLLKMKAVCRGEVFLVWINGESTWEKHAARLCRLLHGTAFVRKPKARLLVKVVRELGGRPEIRTVPFPFVEIYSSKENALERLRKYFKADAPGHADILSRYLDEHLERRNGAFLLNLPATAWVLSW